MNHEGDKDVWRPRAHQFDDDAVCTRCGFDAAEWHWLRAVRPECCGPMPACPKPLPSGEEGLTASET